MANAIVEIKKEKGGCLPQDLHEKEFTPTEVAERWHMANAMADIEMKLMDSKPSHRKRENKNA
jgi:hypothetical protein